MNTTLPKTMRRAAARYANEVKIVRLRETPLPESLHLCDTPDKAEEYWRGHVATAPWFNGDVENCVVLMLNARRRIMAHHLVATGLLDTLLLHSREIFRASIVANASAIIIMHNHPSGDPTPSEADIKVTRDLFRAGQLLKIEVLDHVIVGAAGKRTSLKELGYFYN